MHICFLFVGLVMLILLPIWRHGDVDVGSLSDVFTRMQTGACLIAPNSGLSGNYDNYGMRMSCGLDIVTEFFFLPPLLFFFLSLRLI